MTHYSEDYTIGNRKDKKLDSGLKVQPPVMYAKHAAAKNKYFESDKVENSNTLNEVISDMIAREKIGLKKYGTTIDREDYSLKDWMQHHYEELLDAALYVKKQIQILENKNK
jgi:hypothetical protein